MTAPVEVLEWTHDVLLSVTELSHALGYEQRTGAANLRDRKADFPGPAEGEGRNARYRLSDVLEWFRDSGHPLLRQPDVLPYLTRLVRHRLARPEEADLLRRVLAYVAAEIGGLDVDPDSLGDAYPARSRAVSDSVGAIRAEEEARPLLGPAIDQHGLEAVVDAILDEESRSTGGKATFSSTGLIEVVVRLASELGTFDVVADPCVGEGALAVAVAREVGATKVFGADIDRAALAVFELRRKLAGLAPSEPGEGASVLAVCDAPLQDKATDWIKRVQELKDSDGSAIAAVRESSFGGSADHAHRSDLLDSGELVAAVRLPEAMKGHGRVPGQAIVLLGPEDDRLHISLVDHRATTIGSPGRPDRASAALDKSLASLDVDVEPGSGRPQQFVSFTDFADSVTAAVFDPDGSYRVPVDEVRQARRHDLWTKASTGDAVEKMREVVSSLEEAMQALRLIADLAADPARAPETSGSERMFVRAWDELRRRLDENGSDLEEWRGQ